MDEIKRRIRVLMNQISYTLPRIYVDSGYKKPIPFRKIDFSTRKIFDDFPEYLEKKYKLSIKDLCEYIECANKMINQSLIYKEEKHKYVLEVNAQIKDLDERLNDYKRKREISGRVLKAIEEVFGIDRFYFLGDVGNSDAINQYNFTEIGAIKYYAERWSMLLRRYNYEVLKSNIDERTKSDADPNRYNFIYRDIKRFVDIAGTRSKNGDENEIFSSFRKDLPEMLQNIRDLTVDMLNRAPKDEKIKIIEKFKKLINFEAGENKEVNNNKTLVSLLNEYLTRAILINKDVIGKNYAYWQENILPIFDNSNKNMAIAIDEYDEIIDLKEPLMNISASELPKEVTNDIENLKKSRNKINVSQEDIDAFDKQAKINIVEDSIKREMHRNDSGIKQSAKINVRQLTMKQPYVER